MMSAFDPADPQTWVARGRRPDHAAIMARAWQTFPDLPNDAPAAQRMARTRERVQAMRPVMEAIQAEQERQRQARNFAFTQERIARSEGDERDAAILRGRDNHGYDWDASVQFAYGLYAARAGWICRPPEVRNGNPADIRLRAAYMTGFDQGGGDTDDLFDVARRALVAPERPAPAPRLKNPPDRARPLPSTWPKPSDTPRPTTWRRRLLIIGAPETGMLSKTEINGGLAHAALLPLLRDRPEADQATIIVVCAGGFLPVTEPVVRVAALRTAGDVERLTANPAPAAALAALLAGRDFDEILVAAQGLYLDALDAHAKLLPLCRVMERTRNSLIQQKAHFRIWLDRGVRSGETLGAGHIRWGKVANGLTARLGEFTARYAGKEQGRGHRILVELPNGDPANGFMTVRGDLLQPEILITNQKHLRPSMAAGLRAFGGATRLSPAS
ncbi:hypothetical protein AWL63_23425 (plasmid) [Sphingomonas panacis]|uniref:Uncharacterized protein n=1 Tax=Sphingomonas panacis TaxID=1560345 RepID=A0A1B3ZI73_9SPHN|nr:hypothetical protein [Sphingomonas panacis]AOH87128.1 hypothetical protein AWL63_23425 [Sphingomonas panacis]